MRVRAFCSGQWLGFALLTVPFILTGLEISAAEGGKRQIEEVIVTAERQEASVQDTSISITAFTGEFMDDFGIRNQSDLQNYIPATTIQPYDATVRGVGRNFRNLGGDPGVATYMNGVYSEDFYTATVGGGFFDVERVEVLRGPQGTLYGRNAVGGAINVLYNKPTQEFEALFKTITGNFDTEDYYGVISGPIIKDVLSARLTGANRARDGVVRNKGIGPDLDSINEENYTLQFQWTPSDDLELNIRANEATVHRIMGGANGGGLIVLDQGGRGQKNFEQMTFGFRELTGTTDPLSRGFRVPGAETFTFTNPVTGADVEAQWDRPGIDTAFGVGQALPNAGFGETSDPKQCVFSDRDNIDGDDICAFTNGFNKEAFDQQGVQFDVEWQARDNLALKYIFGYNDLFYGRITDEDFTSSTNNDGQFYVNHEAEYVSHEVQSFWDVSDTLSFTSGVFYYKSLITQRGQFTDSTGGSRFTNAAADPKFIPVAPGVNIGLNTALFGDAPQVGLFTAKRAGLAGTGVIDSFGITTVSGTWDGSSAVTPCGSCPDDVTGTYLQYDTRSEREAFAAYTQGVWDINDKFTLTFGLRWARDNLDGEENAMSYQELTTVPGTGGSQTNPNGGHSGSVAIFNNQSTAAPVDIGGAFFTPEGGVSALPLSLATYNVLTGALDPTTLQPTGAVPVRFAGAPFSLGLWRADSRSDTKVTGRLNLDWNLNDDSLMYFSVTSGYRAGGFNLVFFSEAFAFDPEELLAYEIGYKSQFFDNTLQINASVYYYDYETIHSVGTSTSAVAGAATSVLEAPGAEVFGLEGEVLWLATDRLTLGGNFSYTPSEYTKDLIFSDQADPNVPGSLFSLDERKVNIKGNQLLQVPEGKFTVFGTYDVPLGDMGNLQFLTTYSWIDDVYFSPFETKADLAPSSYRWDARTTWKSPQNRWIVSAFVNNITDVLGIRQIVRSSETRGFVHSAQTTEPRIWGVELSLALGAY